MVRLLAHWPGVSDAAHEPWARSWLLRGVPVARVGDEASLYALLEDGPGARAIAVEEGGGLTLLLPGEDARAVAGADAAAAELRAASGGLSGLLVVPGAGMTVGDLVALCVATRERIADPDRVYNDTCAAAPERLTPALLTALTGPAPR